MAKRAAREAAHAGSAAPPTSAAPHGSRPTAAAAAAAAAASSATQAAAPPPGKKHKRHQGKAEKFQQLQATWRELIASGPRGARKVLWDWFMQYRGQSLTEERLEKLAVTEEHFREKEDYEATGDVAELPAFARDVTHSSGALISSGESSEVETGTPRLIVLCGSANRATDIVRALRACESPKRPIAKLFARHIKLSEHEELLQNKRVDIAVGTPHRILQLFESTALQRHAKLVVIFDCTVLDERKRTLLEMGDVREPLLTLLEKHIFPPAVRTGFPKIALF